MEKVFSKPAELEKLSKEKFSVPPFLMMENASRYMADFILSQKPQSVLFVCGKGNNGGDGLACARMICGKTKVYVLCQEEPKACEAIAQYKMAVALGIEIFTELKPQLLQTSIVVDCLFGIGFHGELNPQAKDLLDKLNETKAIKIACDCPSALYFKADYTITMGEHKLSLFSDSAKEVCGKILSADLGMPAEKFQAQMEPDAFLLHWEDAKLPVRVNPSAHKGTYGHTTVIAGHKAGAGIIAATAAMNFGSGLTTLLQTEYSNLDQFKISPELMIGGQTPPKTTALVAGPGFTSLPPELSEKLYNWCKNSKSPALVLDAGILTSPDFPQLLDKLNSIPHIRIVLTPHLGELSTLLQTPVSTFAINMEEKIRLGKEFTKKYSNTVLIMKSANTFIFSKDKVYICADGCQSLAKGGSGDVLAGMTGALLAQGYDAAEAGITAVLAHARAAQQLGQQRFDLTPEKLIESLGGLC